MIGYYDYYFPNSKHAKVFFSLQKCQYISKDGDQTEDAIKNGRVANNKNTAYYPIFSITHFYFFISYLRFDLGAS